MNEMMNPTFHTSASSPFPPYTYYHQSYFYLYSHPPDNPHSKYLVGWEFLDALEISLTRKSYPRHGNKYVINKLRWKFAGGKRPLLFSKCHYMIISDVSTVCYDAVMQPYWRLDICYLLSITYSDNVMQRVTSLPCLLLIAHSKNWKCDQWISEVLCWITHSLHRSLCNRAWNEG